MRFSAPPEFAATALHELAHWTGHPSRLNRDMGLRFGSAGLSDGRTNAAGWRPRSSQPNSGIPTDIPQQRELYRRLDQAAQRR
jgi:hypothetical protein